MQIKKGKKFFLFPRIEKEETNKYLTTCTFRLFRLVITTYNYHE